MMKRMKEKLKKFFKNERGIVALYLFGSHAKKSKRIPEDVDVAVFYERGSIPNPRQTLEIQEKLAGLLKKDVDFVMMNRANPILKHQIFREGKLLLNNNPSHLNEFFARSVTEYDEIKRVRRPIEQSILKGRVYGK